MKNVIASLIKQMIFWLSLSVLLLSFYFQYSLGLEPCPLCLMQRLCVGLITLLSLIGLWLRRPAYAAGLLLTQLVFVVFGLFFALRQIWLQSLPPGSAPACMPDMSVLIHYFPWQDVLHAFIWGAGDCAQIPWQWLGLSLAGWSLVYFVVLALATLYLQLQHFFWRS